MTGIFLRINAAAAAAKSLQSCLTLCDPIDGSPLGSPVPGILQARTLECVAISFSNAGKWKVGKWKVKVKSLSRVQLLVTPWTAAYQAPPSMGFSRQEYWSGVPSPSPRINAKQNKYLKNIFLAWTFVITPYLMKKRKKKKENDKKIQTVFQPKWTYMKALGAEMQVRIWLLSTKTWVQRIFVLFTCRKCLKYSS